MSKTIDAKNSNQTPDNDETNEENNEYEDEQASTPKPPQPPPRLASRQTSKMIPLTPIPDEEEGDKKPVRPAWFRIAYIAVACTIFGILAAVAGIILIILRWTQFKSVSEGRNHSYYYGRRVPKLLGVYVLTMGVVITLFGWLFYHAALIRIDRYIEALQEYNSKKKQDLREANLFTERDPLMEEEEDDYYEQKKKQLD